MANVFEKMDAINRANHKFFGELEIVRKSIEQGLTTKEEFNLVLPTKEYRNYINRLKKELKDTLE